MKNYKKLTTEQLLAELDLLSEAEGQDNAMDESGECGGLIHQTYKPYYKAIDKELNARGYYKNLFEISDCESINPAGMPY